MKLSCLLYLGVCVVLQVALLDAQIATYKKGDELHDSSRDSMYYHSRWGKSSSQDSRISKRRSVQRRPTGPSGATMRQTVVSGGYMSGGYFNATMGAGACIGHGHR